LYSLIAILVIAFGALVVDLAGTAGKFTVFGHGTPIKQGLDLTGGIRVLLTAANPKLATPDSMAAAIDVITKRVNAYGVSEPSISQVGSDSIDVEVPDVKNPDELRSSIGSTGQLYIYGMGILPPMSAGQAFTQTTNIYCDAKNAPTPCLVMAGSDLDLGAISTGYDNYGAPLVNFGAKGKGEQELASYTEANAGGKGSMAIVLDGKVVTDPTIQGAIPNGQGQITGIGSIDEANNIAIQLKYGALPIAFNISASEQVSATLGPAYVHSSIIAGIVGLAIVMIFMLVYYRLPGLLADCALLIYAAVVLAIFKLIPVTLTLEGIAGFILSVGMAVDANILIFERLKEELRAGKTLGAAIEAGFNRAWTSIRDSNISTMITCVVLYEFGQNFAASIIVGFALTLGIGVAVSLCTAVFVTRTFLRVIVRNNVTYNHSLFGAGLENVPTTARPVRPPFAG
jgi:preprotein translocase subunit SecD